MQIYFELKELNFPEKLEIEKVLKQFEIINLNGTSTSLEDFQGQFELGKDSNIPHYQLALKTDTICTRPKVLEYFQECLQAHINVEVQFPFEKKSIV